HAGLRRCVPIGDDVKRAIALFAATGGAVLIAWIAGSRALSGETLATSWPPPTFVQQFPDRKENDSASRLLATVERFSDDLGKARPALRDFIRTRGRR